jgi:hypothetical protein
VKIFKVIQRIMGDRERDRPVGVLRKAQDPSSSSAAGGSSSSSSSPSPVSGGAGMAMANGSTVSLSPTTSVGVLEEERWLLSEGLLHGELRDEIYCQVMKQLSGNPNPCVSLVLVPSPVTLTPKLVFFDTESVCSEAGSCSACS